VRGLPRLGQVSQARMSNSSLVHLRCPSNEGFIKEESTLFVHLCLSAELSDVSLKVAGGAVLPAHRMVLAQCTYFDRLFLSSMKESSSKVVELPEVSKTSARLLLCILYGRGAVLPEEELEGPCDKSVQGDSNFKQVLKLPDLLAYLRETNLMMVESKWPSKAVNILDRFKFLSGEDKAIAEMTLEDHELLLAAYELSTPIGKRTNSQVPVLSYAYLGRFIGLERYCELTDPERIASARAVAFAASHLLYGELKTYPRLPSVVAFVFGWVKVCDRYEGTADGIALVLKVLDSYADVEEMLVMDISDSPALSAYVVRRLRAALIGRVPPESSQGVKLSKEDVLAAGPLVTKVPGSRKAFASSRTTTCEYMWLDKAKGSSERCKKRGCGLVRRCGQMRCNEHSEVDLADPMYLSPCLCGQRVAGFRVGLEYLCHSCAEEKKPAPVMGKEYAKVLLEEQEVVDAGRESME
jgi:hypothetical protein